MDYLEINAGKIIQLGDTISILFGIHNYSHYHQKHIRVSSPIEKEKKLLKDLLYLFPSPLCSVGDVTDNSVNIDFLYDIFWKCYLKDIPCCVPYPIRIYEGLGEIFGGSTPGPMVIPKCILEKKPEDIVLIQFDSRSISDFKKPLTKFEMKTTINEIVPNEKIGFIGGPDTSPYIGGEQRYGDIKYMTQQMLNCKKFVGCDSGVSHLAGLLEKEMTIVPLSRTQRVIEYYSWYKNCTIYPRNWLGPSLL